MENNNSVKLEFSTGQSKRPQDINWVGDGWQSLRKNCILLHSRILKNTNNCLKLCVILSQTFKKITIKIR